MYVQRRGSLGQASALAAEQESAEQWLFAILFAMRRELERKFTDPNDPGLHQRRLRLRELFRSVPLSYAKTLYDRLKVRRKDDELSRLFHYRLATPTRREMLRILRQKPKMARPKGPSLRIRGQKQEAGVTIDLGYAVERNRHWGKKLGWWDRRSPIALLLRSSLGLREDRFVDESYFAKMVALWQQRQGLKADGILGPKTWRRMRAAKKSAPARIEPAPRVEAPKKKEVTLEDIQSPLPASLEPELRHAVERWKILLLRQHGYSLSFRRTKRLLCYLDKLLERGVDDRVIFWNRICPTEEFRDLLSIFGWRPCGYQSVAPELTKYLKDKTDVEKANEKLGFIFHLKPYILNLHRMYPPGDKELRVVLQDLEILDKRIIATKTRVNLVKHGVMVTMKREYTAIDDWIIDRERDRNSVYYCTDLRAGRREGKVLLETWLPHLRP
jgi:hypothetical protein